MRPPSTRRAGANPREKLMTALELARIVKDCRRAQRLYFRTRTEDALAESRRLERELDKLLDEILTQPTFPGLMPSEN